jgi:hypothetical protein
VKLLRLPFFNIIDELILEGILLFLSYLLVFLLKGLQRFPESFIQRGSVSLFLIVKDQIFFNLREERSIFENTLIKELKVRNLLQAVGSLTLPERLDKALLTASLLLDIIIDLSIGFDVLELLVNIIVVFFVLKFLV